MGHAQRQAGACLGRTSGFVAPASCRHHPTGGSQGLLGESWGYPNVRAASQRCRFSPKNGDAISIAILREHRERGAQFALRMPLRRISHIAVMWRRFSARQKLIPLNLTNYQLPLFRMLREKAANRMRFSRVTKWSSRRFTKSIVSERSFL